MSSLKTNAGTGANSDRNRFSGIHSVVFVVGLLTVLLLIAGALVTSNVAGDSVPDWPLSLGRLVLFGSRKFVGNVRYEYTHRAIAGAVAFSTGIAALWIWLKPELRRRFGWLSLIAFSGVLFQAALGGVRVLLPEYKNPIAIFHAFIAQGFFLLVVSLWVVTSRSWNNSPSVRQDSSGVSLRSVSAATVVVILLQLILGAGFRHDELPIGWHIGGAVAVTAMVLWTAILVFSRESGEPYLRRPTIILLVMLVCQVGLGIGAYVARVGSANDPQPLEPMVSLTVVHVVVGALTLACALILAMRCSQILAPRAEANAIPALSAR